MTDPAPICRQILADSAGELGVASASSAWW
jgi:hypothetical protein